MTATSLDLSQIRTDALSAASTFRSLIGLGSSATLNAGSANGVATLGADSKLTAAQIPDISLISYLGSVASQAAMLALTGQQGDWCVRSDLSTTWVITGSDPTLLANWTQLSYPSVPVQSVFGRTGNVVGVSTDYSSVGITNTAIGASNPSTGAFTTLTTTGNVGIGISSPTAPLSLSSATGQKINVYDNASGMMGFGVGNSEFQIGGYGSGTNQHTSFGHWGAATKTFAEQVRLNHDTGNVGIGTTSPSAKLDVAGGTVTTSTPVLNLTQTWNASGTTFTGILANITDTASASGSLLLDLQVGGSSKFKVGKAGGITATTATLSATLDLTIRTVTYGATMAIDAALGNKIAITLTGNGTISNPTNSVDGRVLVFRLRQDGSGNRVPVWDTKFAFVGDIATVTLSTGANKIDRVAFEYDSTDDKWYCISFIKGS